MLYERMKSYFRVSGSSKIKTFTKCILSALLAAEVAAYITYSCVKSEEKTEDIAETEGSYISQEKMQEIYDPCVRVNLHYTLKKDIDGTEEQIHPFGSGVLLEDRLTWELYVLTANHVTPSDTYENKSGEKFKVVESNMEVESLEAKVIKKMKSRLGFVENRSSCRI